MLTRKILDEQIGLRGPTLKAFVLGHRALDDVRQALTIVLPGMSLDPKSAPALTQYGGIPIVPLGEGFSPTVIDVVCYDELSKLPIIFRAWQ